jgi:hypothetical protein
VASRKRTAATTAPDSREFQARELVFVDLEREHHYVDGICTRCSRDLDERDLPCSKQRELVP